MAIGLIIGNFSNYRLPFWMLVANGVFYTFWFFGRSFVASKIKFPKLDKFILVLALFILIEIVITTLHVLIFNPQANFSGVGYHYIFLNVYTVFSLILSVVLVTKKMPLQDILVSVQW